MSYDQMVALALADCGLLEEFGITAVSFSDGGSVVRRIDGSGCGTYHRHPWASRVSGFRGWGRAAGERTHWAI
jgi:hypothetical protein